MRPKWRGLVYLYILAVVLFILGPVLIIIPQSFSGGDMFSFPPDDFTWKQYEALAEDERIHSSLWLSLSIGAASTCLAGLIGLCAALGIVKGNLPGKNLLESLFLGPLIVPLVTTGIGFLIIFVPLGLVGSPLGIVLAHSIIISPYVVRILIATLRHFDHVQEEAAIVHGADSWYAFRTVVLPQLLPALISGAILAFLVSLDEYTVTIFLAQADTVTIPIRIYQYVAMDINPVVTALASVTVIVSFVLIVLLEKRFKIHKYLEM
ncbi:ABC transporter permease [Brevibacillus humidisoli]|uniref:ABC transporter permease n=1 Tax=Brevibacillus humidisoli TaxID=2895522 RepID=UPI001E5ADF5E|nr:ABC transporter permease [Brevibacillus humidisoli]UFJ41846.1 ABC transporter permease [Brevibacillus humidisoli]